MTTDRIPVMVAHGVVKPSEEVEVPVRLMSESVTLLKGLTIASVSAIEGSSICGLCEDSATVTKKPCMISQSKRDTLWKVVERSSEAAEKEKLFQLLLEYGFLPRTVCSRPYHEDIPPNPH